MSCWLQSHRCGKADCHCHCTKCVTDNDNLKSNSLTLDATLTAVERLEPTLDATLTADAVESVDPACIFLEPQLFNSFQVSL